jgi:hypothetical protein
MKEPFADEQLSFRPANEASWEDLEAIFGTTDAGHHRDQRRRLTHPTVRRVVLRLDL